MLLLLLPASTEVATELIEFAARMRGLASALRIGEF
jgi:hypothetical protein